jgi:hypothetical protein
VATVVPPRVEEEPEPVAAVEGEGAEGEGVEGEGVEGEGSSDAQATDPEGSAEES